MTLTDLQEKRYARQLAMPEIGRSGQEKLLSASVLVIGAGGLGSPAAMYLAAAGVGTIGLADGDTVELSNLQRQILYRTELVGAGKAVSGAETLRALNPDVRVRIYPVYADEGNIRELIADYDFILECTDSYRSKYLVNDACVRAGKPFCHGAVGRFCGQIMTVLPGSACYRCAFPETTEPGTTLETGKPAVIGAVTGVIGSMQALEAVKFLAGTGRPLSGRLLTFDALEMEFQSIRLSRSQECPACALAGKRHPVETGILSEDQDPVGRKR